MMAQLPGQANRAAGKAAAKFTELLKGYAHGKDLTADTTWGPETQELLGGHSAFKAIGEPERATLFDEVRPAAHRGPRRADGAHYAVHREAEGAQGQEGQEAAALGLRQQ